MPSFLQKFRDFLAHPSNSRTMGLVVMLVLVAAVSLTVYVAQQQQQLKQRAAENFCADTTISECTDAVAANGNDCAANPDFKCKITTGNEYKVYGCQ